MHHRKDKPDRSGGSSLPASLDRHRILTIEQFAELRNLSTAHVRRLYRSGVLPRPIKIGARKLGYTVGMAIDLNSSEEAA